MYLVTLEGLPHSGKCALLRSLLHQCPAWSTANVAPDPAAACTWASPSCRTHHALFASLLRKVLATSKAPQDGVLLLNSPWFEHLPRTQEMWRLMADVTQLLVASVGCSVKAHIMILLQVPHDETFEQMVCCGNPFWNGTSLADVQHTQTRIAHHVTGVAGLTGAAGGLSSGTGHPFPCVAYTIRCPPFFEENEVVAQAIARDIIAMVTSVTAHELKRGGSPANP